MRLELGKCHLNRIEIWRVSRQEEESGAALSKGRLCLGAVVHFEIVEDDNVTRPERRGELGFDIDIESCTVHCTGNDPGSRQPGTSQGGNKGLIGPMSVWYSAWQSCTFRRSASKPRELGVGRSFIDEYQPNRHLAHDRLTTMDPAMAFSFDVWTSPLRCDQNFFYT
jgi:hypothetical protein